MTIDNVLEILEKHKLRIPSNVFYELKADIVNFEELTTKNDLGVDCISRQEVLQLLANSIGKTNTYLQTAVLKMSSVTPQEPRKGEWCPQNDDYFDWYECSECGYGNEGEMQYSSEYDVRTNYCPNCGADMRGEE